MPQLNGTGPRGFGPGTGRGMGRCNGVRKCAQCSFFQGNQETLENEEKILKERLEEIQKQKKSQKN